jgi:hypothetical protein
MTGAVSSNYALQEAGQLLTRRKMLDEALDLVTRSFLGNQGRFVHEAFDWINHTLHDGNLPRPLIVWNITPYGRCLGFTVCDTSKPPLIQLHPSVLGGSGDNNPWGVAAHILGRCFAVDVLIHECTHVKVEFLLGGSEGKGTSSHDNPLWVEEVNRQLPLLGVNGVRAERTKSKRMGKKVAKVNEGNVPFAAVATFPHAVRFHRGLADYYVRNELPFTTATKVIGRSVSRS